MGELLFQSMKGSLQQLTTMLASPFCSLNNAVKEVKTRCTLFVLFTLHFLTLILILGTSPSCSHSSCSNSSSCSHSSFFSHSLSSSYSHPPLADHPFLAHPAPLLALLALTLMVPAHPPLIHLFFFLHHVILIFLLLQYTHFFSLNIIIFLYSS